MNTRERQIISISLGLLASSSLLGAKAPEFNKVFNDSTLRIDYIFGGDAKSSHIFVDKMQKSEGWYGRRANLDSLPYVGNGNVIMRDVASGDTIYALGFSSLFHEWQSTEEALSTPRSFSHTLLMPLPRKEAEIIVTLLDLHHKPVTETSHRYRPDDILVSRPAHHNVTPHEYLHRGGDSKDVIDVAILAEGYTRDEMDKFREDALKTVDALFSHEPFASRRNCFNFVAVYSESADSGMSVPHDNNWKSTAFSSNFDTFYTPRYLTTTHTSDIHNALQGIPYEHIIVLGQSDVYGGGGIYNSYTLTTTGHDRFAPVVVHEFGHSFGGLADEYFYTNDVFSDYYPLDVEPWEPNITTLVDFGSKWESIIPKKTPRPTPEEKAAKYPVGLYEGGGYAFKGVYRPADHCRMRDNATPGFCPACQRALNMLIDFYIGNQR